MNCVNRCNLWSQLPFPGSVADGGPEAVPVEGAAELALMASGAVAGGEGTEMEVRGCARLTLGDVCAARTMAALAPNVS